MLVAGIDAGIENTKAVILRDGEVLAAVVVPGGKDPAATTADEALGLACSRAELSGDALRFVVATGIAKDRVACAGERASDALCLAIAADILLPRAHTVVDVGAQRLLVVKCRSGRPTGVASNDRCAVGSGRYLVTVAEILRMDVADIGGLALQATEDLELSNTCAVFAESEIVSLIHLKKRPADILRGVFKGLVDRIYGQLLRAGGEREVAIVGGVARNVGVLHLLEERLGHPVLVPSAPAFVSAYGAAVLALRRASGSVGQGPPV